MKISQFSSLLCLASVATAAAAAAHEEENRNNLRSSSRRYLQFSLEDWFGGQDEEQESQTSPIDSMLDDLANGFEEMINMSALVALDPWDMGGTSIVVNDTLNVTTCTGPINVTTRNFILTGLSSLSMDQFDLVPNTDTETNDWWSGFMSWTGTFDMLMTGGNITLDGLLSVATDDLACLGEGAPAGGFFETGVVMNLVNPKVEVSMDIGGSSPTGMLATMFGSNEADSISTNNVSFTYESWTIELINPLVNQTIDVGDLIETVSGFLSTVNTSDILGNLEGMDGFMPDGLDLDLESMSGGIDSFLQSQFESTVATSKSFPF